MKVYVAFVTGLDGYETFVDVFSSFEKADEEIKNMLDEGYFIEGITLENFAVDEMKVK